MKLTRDLPRLAILLAAILLAGCSGTAARTAISEPTVVPLPSATFTRQVVSTSTPRVTLVARYTSTPRLITPAPAEGTFLDQSILSPDGEWTALPAFDDIPGGYRISLTISNKDKSTVWTPVDYTGEGLGYNFPFPKQWSADSRYFYYLERAVGDGCGDFYPLETVWQRFDVQTGKADSIELPVGRDHSFSPDGATLAYTSDASPVELVLVDTASQAETRLELPIEPLKDQIPQAGGIRWSPDGASLVLAAANGNLCVASPLEFYLIKVELADGSAHILYQGDDFVRPLAWGAAGKIRVMDWNSKSWWIESVTGKLTTAP